MNAQTTPAKSVKDILSAYSIPAELKSKAWSDVYLGNFYNETCFWKITAFTLELSETQF